MIFFPAIRRRRPQIPPLAQVRLLDKHKRHVTNTTALNMVVLRLHVYTPGVWGHVACRGRRKSTRYVVQDAPTGSPLPLTRPSLAPHSPLTHTRSGRRERAAVECNASPRRRRQDGQTKRSSGDGPQQSVLRTLDVLETGALAAASVAGAKVLMDSRGGAGGSVQSQATTSATSGTASTTLSALVLVSLILRKATARLTEMKRESSPTSQAMMRLQNAELAVEQQGRAVEAVMKDTAVTAIAAVAGATTVSATGACKILSKFLFRNKTAPI